MAVINVTPDSFSDGGQYSTAESALDCANRMIAEGADIIDIGGESTRPATFHDGTPITAKEEIERVVPAIQAIRRAHPHTPLSIDTYKAEVASAALDAGATIINDISALRYDPGMAKLAAERTCPLILMHLPGKPRNIDVNVDYGDIMKVLATFFKSRVRAAEHAGILRSNLVIDPGLGFGKNVSANLEIIRRLGELRALQLPILVGPSRKRFIGSVLDTEDPLDRVEGTCAAAALSIAHGAALIRGHDIKELVRTARMTDAILLPSLN